MPLPIGTNVNVLVPMVTPPRANIDFLESHVFCMINAPASNEVIFATMRTECMPLNHIRR